MSVAVCRGSAASLTMPVAMARETLPNASWASIPTSNWLAPAGLQHKTGVAVPENNKPEERPGQFDIWSMIQSQKAAAAAAPPEPYVHPLVRRSTSLMSEKSLEMCTESLGSESGSDDFSSSLSTPTDTDYSSSSVSSEMGEEDELEEEEENNQIEDEGAAGYGRKELSSVNYHCSISRRSPPRSFPPPLRSISRRDGLCLHMRPHRRDGRLVVEAVPVPSQNYLHARRQDGRLLLSFVDATFHQPSIQADNIEMPPQPPEQEQIEEPSTVSADESEEKVCYEEDEEDEEIEEEEEEVEVVDRGTVVEVKVSTQPQQQSGSMRVHRSSLVINKFVGGTPLTNQNRWTEPPPRIPEEEDKGENIHAAAPEATAPPRRAVPTTTTAAAAAVAASSMSAVSEAVGPPPENKLLFTSKRRNREELLHHMRRCSELRRPLFFWEPGCIATSS